MVILVGQTSPGKKKFRFKKNISAARITLFQKKLLSWYKKNGRHDLPWRARPTPYRVFVAEVMLQQTQASRVRERYGLFLKKYPTVSALAKAKQRELLREWSGLGYNRRALHLRETARIVVRDYKGNMPTTPSVLETLPGIGPYTANAIAVFSRNKHNACVDTNVRRVLVSEFHLPAAISDHALSIFALSVVPLGRSRDWHNALMDYGALVLTAKKTGLTPRVKQPRFQGSRRQKRGAILRHLLNEKSSTIAHVARLLRIDRREAESILRALTEEKFLHQQKQRYSLAEDAFR